MHNGLREPRALRIDGAEAYARSMRTPRFLHDHATLTSPVGEINICTRLGRADRVHYRPCADADWIRVPLDRYPALIAARSKEDAVDAIFDDVLPAAPVASEDRVRLS